MRSWAPWRLVGADDTELSPSDYQLLDTIAEYTAHPDQYFDEIRHLYRSTEALRPPEEILAHTQRLFEAGARRVEFGTPHGIKPQDGIRLLGERVLPYLERK